MPDRKTRRGACRRVGPPPKLRRIVITGEGLRLSAAVFSGGLPHVVEAPSADMYWFGGNDTLTGRIPADRLNGATGYDMLCSGTGLCL